jgi:hypothetical protein
MRWHKIFRSVVCMVVRAFPAALFAQAPAAGLGALPTALSVEQMEALSVWTPGPLCAPPQVYAQRGRPRKTLPPLTAQQLEFRDSVRALGADNHHFVRVELTNGEVRTGAIISIDDASFRLRDGIIASRAISYSELKASPVHVAAVGTHVANGFKWAGTVTGITGLCILAIPLLVVFIPLLAAGVISD